ncbi:MAG: U32 family peptidase [Muribaculaceae bacterium]|nr:U32 family peptidase [Muribaculaceae bacterium]
MSKSPIRKLELLAPAANKEIAISAILHGADAVYIGANNYGARKNASNSVEDIEQVVEFAHQFRARVYVTLNTILYEKELKDVERLCRKLYKIGVDALIVQDMSLLRLDIPPIALHASTQCDIRTPEKARFLESVGFSQLVLARELTLSEIKKITDAVTIPVECFVHGALCVSYSGRCHASYATIGRSANRGECAQLCRLPYTLQDSNGKILAKNKHLLSLRDLNLSSNIPDLVQAGVSSFKIEGRLKEVGYVKNITAKYNQELNSFISRNKDNYVRSSFGHTEYVFNPKVDKSFNRGFTTYFIEERKPAAIASLLTPKSMGETIKDLRLLHNGDGVSYFDKKGEYQGFNISKIENGKIIPSGKSSLPHGVEIHRTHDVEWQKLMNKSTSKRKLNVDISIDNSGISAFDERGMIVRLPLNVTKEKARKKMDYSEEFRKLGNTIYSLREFSNGLDNSIFIPRSELADLRRKLLLLLDKANKSTYRYDRRREEDKNISYPSDKLDFRDNVSNSVAKLFYFDHGVKHIENAIEITGKAKATFPVMTTRHCILRELGICKKNIHPTFIEPLTLTNQKFKFQLKFDCKNCEMQVLANQ